MTTFTKQWTSNRPRIFGVFGKTQQDDTFEILIPKFLDYAQFDLKLAKETIGKYKESLGWVTRYLPDVERPAQMTLEDVTRIKKQVAMRGNSEARTNSIIFALRKFLDYCGKRMQIETIDPKTIEPLKIPKREVIYLNKDEIKNLRDVFDLANKREFRMRVLVEFLLGTGMRISEALSVNREQINYDSKEIKIVGKGNKERTVFVSDDALGWIKRYLDTRTDDNPAVFITFGEQERLRRGDLAELLRGYGIKAGLQKKVTPHILRHSSATTMMRKGCPLPYIQQLLGHADIKTTAKYYLGVDKQSVKDAHEKYLKFDHHRLGMAAPVRKGIDLDSYLEYFSAYLPKE